MLQEPKIAGKTYVSNSSLSCFRRCPYKFNLSYREKVKPLYKPANFLLGTCIHSALEYYYQNNRETRMAIEVFCSAWDGGTRELPIKYNEKRGICTPEDGREMGVKMLEAYFDRWLLDDALWEVLEVEKEFSFKLENGMEITGIIDLIVRDTQTKEILVVDHKTASQVVDQDFLQMENQVSTYYLGAQSLGYKVDGAVFNYIYKYVKPKCERYPVKRNDQQIAEFLEDVKGTLEAMADDKYKYKNITKDCNWCDYWEWCRGNQEMYTKASDGSTEASEEEE